MSLIKRIFFSFIVIANYYSSIAFAEDTSSQDDWPANYLKAISTPTPEPKTDNKKPIKSKHTNLKCSENAAFCGDYVAKKITKALGDMPQYHGLRVTVKIHINKQAGIETKEIIKPSGNNEFDSYVINNIDKAAPFSEITELDDKSYEQLRTINATITPEEKIKPFVDESEQKCISNHINCMSYSAAKIIRSLGDTRKLNGLTVSLRVELNKKAYISNKIITKSSGDPKFDAYVLSHINKAAPFTALITPENIKYKELRTINMSFSPTR